MATQPRVELAAAAPSLQAFYRDHVQPRKPVRCRIFAERPRVACHRCRRRRRRLFTASAHLPGCLQGLFPVSPDLEHLQGLWTDEYLTRTAVGGEGGG